jgi:hypothetical protein
MTPKYNHSPVVASPQRERCPVCRQPVYSRAGIHPQCAVRQAEPPRPKAIKPAAPEPVAAAVAERSSDRPGPAKKDRAGSSSRRA